MLKNSKPELAIKIKLTKQIFFEKTHNLTFQIDRIIVKRDTPLEAKEMNTVKVSPKFQIVIPEEVRKSMGIKPGERIQVIQYGDRIELIPVKSIKEMR